MSLKHERMEAAGEVWQHEASMEAVALHKGDTPRTDATVTIIPSELDAESLYNRNGEYVQKEDMRKLERELSATKQQLDEAEKDANRWRSLPAFEEKYQINYVGLLKDIDEYNAEAARQK